VVKQAKGFEGQGARGHGIGDPMVHGSDWEEDENEIYCQDSEWVCRREETEGFGMDVIQEMVAGGRLVV